MANSAQMVAQIHQYRLAAAAKDLHCQQVEIRIAAVNLDAVLLTPGFEVLVGVIARDYFIERRVKRR